jgi:serine/threonine protein kinase
MATTKDCPSAVDLEQFRLGRLSEAKGARLKEHVRHCARCQDVLKTVDANDTLAALLRQGGAANVLEAGGDTRSEARGPGSAASAAAPPGAQVPGRMNPYDFLAPAKEPDEIGRLGNYRVLKVLGAGGMGVVFQAEDPVLKRRVALKAMLPSLAADESARLRFRREAQTAAAVEHDHIVRIFQVAEDHGVPFIAMPFLKGESLDARLKRESRLPIPEVLRIGKETAQGLAAAHANGLVHRDIKPANLWLEGSEGRVKILDFGLAKAASDAAHLTQSGLIVGTPAYMAPEQGGGRMPEPRSDLFSLGCVLYHACTGERPFQGPDILATLAALALHHPPAPRELRAAVPHALSDLVIHLLAKKPADRPESAEAVVIALREIEEQAAARTAQSPPRSRKVKTTERGARSAERRAGGEKRSVLHPRHFPLPWLVGLSGGLLVVVLAVIVLVWPRPRGVVETERENPSAAVMLAKSATASPTTAQSELSGPAKPGAGDSAAAVRDRATDSVSIGGIKNATSPPTTAQPGPSAPAKPSAGDPAGAFQDLTTGSVYVGTYAYDRGASEKGQITITITERNDQHFKGTLGRGDGKLLFAFAGTLRGKDVQWETGQILSNQINYPTTLANNSRFTGRIQEHVLQGRFATHDGKLGGALRVSLVQGKSPGGTP